MKHGPPGCPKVLLVTQSGSWGKYQKSDCAVYHSSLSFSSRFFFFRLLPRNGTRSLITFQRVQPSRSMDQLNSSQEWGDTNHRTNKPFAHNLTVIRAARVIPSSTVKVYIQIRIRYRVLALTFHSLIATN